MTPDAFFTPRTGQSLFLPGQQAYAGNCVQSVGLWVIANGGDFPTHLYAYEYWDGIPGYVQVPKGSLIHQSDIIIFNSNLPGSEGAGHISVASQDGHPLDFTSWDSNWNPPLALEKIRHNGGEDSYILGYLRKEGEEMLTPAEVNILCAIAFNRQARDDEKAVYSSIPTLEALQRIFDGEENTQLRTEAQAFINGQSGAVTKQAVIDYIGKNLK